MMPRAALALMILVVFATPLTAQRTAAARFGVAHRDMRSVSWASREATSGWEEMHPSARHAIIGGAAGGLVGWLLSGLPCPNAPGSCPSAATSIVAGAAIGAVIGALWPGRGS